VAAAPSSGVSQDALSVDYFESVVVETNRGGQCGPVGIGHRDGLAGGERLRSSRRKRADLVEIDDTEASERRLRLVPEMARQLNASSL
jgi:hypothetical protein